MHFACEIVFPPGNEPTDEDIARVMAPFKEANGSGFWDWYQVGGRFNNHDNPTTVSSIAPGLMAYTLILPDGHAMHRQEWDGQKLLPGEFDGDVLATLKARGISPDHWLVTIDYHS